MSEEIFVRLWARSCHGALSFQAGIFFILALSSAYNIECRSQCPEALEALKHLGPAGERALCLRTSRPELGYGEVPKEWSWQTGPTNYVRCLPSARFVSLGQSRTVLDLSCSV